MPLRDRLVGVGQAGERVEVGGFERELADRRPVDHAHRLVIAEWSGILQDTEVFRYQQTIQQAFRDVADALIEHRKRGEARVQQEALVVSLRDAARLSNVRYRGGVTSYLEVLDTERQLFDAELQLAQAQRDELLAVVRLYRALGGGWMVDQPPTASSRGPGSETLVVDDGKGGARSQTR